MKTIFNLNSSLLSLAYYVFILGSGKMWEDKTKAVTFSFDDGIRQDIRLIEILNKYGLKATFNLNSGLLGMGGALNRNERIVQFDRINASEIKTIYYGHEVAVHTLTHPNLTLLEEEEIICQVEEDRKQLSNYCGYEVVGMAYPCGGENNNARVAKIIQERTGIKYARTITSTKNYELQDNYYRFNPSVYYIENDFEAIVDNFLAFKTDKPQLLYIWGHSFELDAEYISWDTFGRICKKLSNKTDIFYGTNKEVLLGDI